MATTIRTYRELTTDLATGALIQSTSNGSIYRKVSTGTTFSLTDEYGKPMQPLGVVAQDIELPVIRIECKHDLKNVPLDQLKSEIRRRESDW